MSIEAMKQALEAMESFSTGIFKGEFTSEIAALRQAIQDIESYRLAYLDNYAPAHTDHPMRHWDRTCPACVYESDISPERADETVKDRHEFAEMVKKGTKAWADTPDDWVDDLRGGVEKIVPSDYSNSHQPVAWMKVWRDGSKNFYDHEPPVFGKHKTYALYAAPITCQENRQVAKSATTEWVGLTDGEMQEAMEYWSDSLRSSYGGAESASEEYVDMVLTWRYIEAKLKEKNNAA